MLKDSVCLSGCEYWMPILGRILGSDISIGTSDIITVESDIRYQNLARYQHLMSCLLDADFGYQIWILDISNIRFEFGLNLKF